MARLREVALIMCIGLAASACTISDLDSSIEVTEPTVALVGEPEAGPARTPSTTFEGGTGDAGVDATSPQGPASDPPLELGLGDIHVDTDTDTDPAQPGSIVADPGPPSGQVTYLEPCRALRDIVGDTVNDVDAAVAAIRLGTPEQWTDILDAAAPDLRVTPASISVERINALDGYYFDQCEVPLFAGSASLDSMCRGSRVCVRPVVQAVLGGVCFEESTGASPVRSWTLLSCVSGLPA